MLALFFDKIFILNKINLIFKNLLTQARKMKNILIKLTLLCALFFSVQVSANKIEKINFTGLITVSEEALLEIISLEVLEDFSPTVSDNIVQKLFNTGSFSDISIVNNLTELNIALIENPYIKFFNVSTQTDIGLSSWLSNKQDLLSEEIIDNFVTESELSAGSLFTKSKLKIFINNLKEKYIAAGYYNIKIVTNSQIDIQNRIGIDLAIDQGERAKIENIEIYGNIIFDQKELLNLFDIGKANNKIFNYFTNKDTYTDIELQKGLELLNRKYFDMGYLDFQILNVDSKLSDNNEKISINIELSEGIQYKLGSITFQGQLGNQNRESLMSNLNIKTGDVFNRQIVVDDIQKISDIYANQGYAFVNINPITSDFLDSVNVAIDVSLNRKVYINRISITGNTRTQDEVIRREIGISEGGVYSRIILKESIIKLKQLGYFSNVEMDATQVVGMDDKIDLNISVSETKTGAISFSVSHSNNYGISIGAGIKEKNIFGSGNTLNAEFKLSESFNRLSFYFENPNFNDKNHSISYGAFMSEIKDNDVMKDSYEIDSKGLNFGYGIPLSKFTRLNSTLEFSNNKIKCGSGFSTTGYEPKQCVESSSDELRLNLDWDESTLNDYMYPTNGKNNSVNLGVALPGGDYRYFILNASHQSYKPLRKNLTVKLTGDVGLASGYGGKELPFYKRYFGGGSGSIRGFGNKTLGPLYPNKKAKGGELSILGSANIVSPALFFEDNDKMRMSAFIDTGNIFKETSDISLDDLRMSAGFGFAYLSPIGAIGMFWSTPILKKSGDIIENFGFTLGTGF